VHILGASKGGRVLAFMIIGGVGIVLLLVSLIAGEIFDGIFEGVGGDLFSGAAVAGFLAAFGFVGALTMNSTDSSGLAIGAGLGAGVLVGGLAGWALARFGTFRGRALFGTLIGAPLVLPEVVTGLSLLLLFVALEGATGWPQGRGALTVLLAHATLGAAYVAVVVQARLAEADRSLEEAALDLGATPFTAFRTVTLPLMAPSLAAGWLLAFTLSLDDVVLASFVSGPAGTTLPMVLFSKLKLGLTPEVNALGAVILAMAAVCLGMAALVLARLPRHGGSGGPGTGCCAAGRRLGSPPFRHRRGTSQP
jgi:putrescine transport system permease protein